MPIPSVTQGVQAYYMNPGSKFPTSNPGLGAFSNRVSNRVHNLDAQNIPNETKLESQVFDTGTKKAKRTTTAKTNKKTGTAKTNKGTKKTARKKTTTAATRKKTEVEKEFNQDALPIVPAEPFEDEKKTTGKKKTNKTAKNTTGTAKKTNKTAKNTTTTTRKTKKKSQTEPTTRKRTTTISKRKQTTAKNGDIEKKTKRTGKTGNSRKTSGPIEVDLELDMDV
jgi:hypothetical protein